MKRVVIYAMDMEPITVVELDAAALLYLEVHGFVQLWVQPKFSWQMGASDTEITPYRHSIVRILAEPLHRNGVRHLILLTEDEESALLLRAVFLPGQHAWVQERERVAFADGFLEALHRIGQ